jgi:hypothetical protein
MLQDRANFFMDGAKVFKLIIEDTTPEPSSGLNPLDPIEFGIPHFLTMSLIFPMVPIFMPVPLILESSF